MTEENSEFESLRGDFDSLRGDNLQTAPAPQTQVADAQQPLLIARNLQRSFKGRKKPVVDGVSLTVFAGQVHALVGRNGAGKTTTVRMCSTLLVPTAGTVEVSGIDAIAHPEKARQNLGISLGGDRGFYDRADAASNLLFFADTAKVPRRVQRERVWESLERVSLTPHAKDKVGSFSRGMKQRLHIARALLSHPRLLILDEPSSGLDPDAALEVRHLVAELAQGGTGILLTSHSMAEVEELATLISVIDAGKITVRGQVADIAQAAGVQQVSIFTLPASAGALTERLQAEFATTSITPHGPGWRVQVFWHSAQQSESGSQRVQEILGEGLAQLPPDFHTRPVSLEEAFLTLTGDSHASPER
ncbi:ABC transporter ATP-binding protein [Actinobaculum suis]|uniref:ABC transporter ATP-binding protein n=1 Tax=Actinobaculum suis TaxID=1657 RepID=UPI0009E3CD14|nr:ABC transporter ATP-binding protein [Actinobaculum suis]